MTSNQICVTPGKAASAKKVFTGKLRPPAKLGQAVRNLPTVKLRSAIPPAGAPA